PDEISALREGSALVGWLWPRTNPELVQALCDRRITAWGMESIRRATRAQRMDALSSQATVSGYRSVILAAETLPKFFPMLMTAAGTVAPATVLLLCGRGARAPAPPRPGGPPRAAGGPAAGRPRPPAGWAPSSRRSTPARS